MIDWFLDGTKYLSNSVALQFFIKIPVWGLALDSSILNFIYSTKKLSTFGPSVGQIADLWALASHGGKQLVIVSFC